MKKIAWIRSPLDLDIRPLEKNKKEITLFI